MTQNAPCEQLRELIDADLPADELKRLARVDALLRAAAARDRDARDCGRIRPSISAMLDGELSEVESIGVRAHVDHCPACRAFTADAETFAAAVRDAPPQPLGRRPVRPSLRLVATTSTEAGSAGDSTDKDTHELKLTFAELALVYKSLQAVKTLGALPPQDKLLNDTMQLVDLALRKAAEPPAPGSRPMRQQQCPVPVFPFVMKASPFPTRRPRSTPAPERGGTA